MTASLDDMVDELETTVKDLKLQLEEAKTIKPINLADDVPPEVVEQVINAVFYYMREHADAETKQPFINMIRGLVHQVVIGPADNGRDVELYVHGAIVSILATMDTIKAMEAEFRTAQEYQYHELMHKGVLDTEAKREKFLTLCAEELVSKRQEWADLQVSVVAGARFEPVCKDCDLVGTASRPVTKRISSLICASWMPTPRVPTGARWPGSSSTAIRWPNPAASAIAGRRIGTGASRFS